MNPEDVGQVLDELGDRLGLANAVGLSAWALLPGLIVLIMVGTTILNPEYHAMMRLLDRLVPQ